MDILLIEDSQTIIDGLEYAFQSNNYKLTAKKTIKESKSYLENHQPNLIILDITLTDGDGFLFYKEYLSHKNIPCIFLTIKDDEDILVECFKLGCDDYITKPFSSKELLARVERVLRKVNKNSVIKIQDIKFDLDKMQVYKDDLEIELTSLEKNILCLLFLNVGKTVRRGTILDKIWELTGNDVDDHTITVYLKRIREKLGCDIIKTIKGIGYRVDEE